MAYRRKQGISRASTFKEEIRHPPPDDDNNNNNSTTNNTTTTTTNNNNNTNSSPSSSSSSSSLAAQAIRASSAHRDSSFSSAYGEPVLSSSGPREPNRVKSFPARQESKSIPYEYTSIRSMNEPKYGFWGVLARKAKSILEDDNVVQNFDTPGRSKPLVVDTETDDQSQHQYRSPDSNRKMESPSLQKGIEAITSSLNYIGGTIGKSFEEGLTKMEHRTADIIQETRKLHVKRRGHSSDAQNPSSTIDVCSPPLQNLQMQTDRETQLKASRDVAMAMAAKAKLLLREVKAVKADLAFAKERCAQLEEENKILRESREKGDTPEDDDLIRLQLETLLAEKARLAHENSIYARENRFLREIVEYHQLTMQDVVYLDEGIEEVTEVRCSMSSIPTPTESCSPSFIPPPPPPPPLHFLPAHPTLNSAVVDKKTIDSDTEPPPVKITEVLVSSDSCPNSDG